MCGLKERGGSNDLVFPAFNIIGGRSYYSQQSILFL